MDELQSWFVIINPASGGGNTERAWDTIQQLLKAEQIKFDFSVSSFPGEATMQTIQAINNGWRNMLIVGGDGTAHEVINGIMQQTQVESTDIKIGIIPTGTGNDWARMYRIPKDPRKAVRLLKDHRIFTQDVAMTTFPLVPDKAPVYFHNVAGFLFEAYLTKQTEKLDKTGISGKFFYILNLIRYIFKFRPVEIALSGDNFQVKGKKLIVTAGICRYNGGGMNVIPRALPDDGLLEVTVIGKISPWEVIANVAKIYNGRIYRHPKVKRYQTRKLRVASTEYDLFEANGEISGKLPAEITVLPQRLNIAIPGNLKPFQ